MTSPQPAAPRERPSVNTFRKKPVIVKAEQFFKDQPLPLRNHGPVVAFDGYQFYVTTIHGQNAFLADGDWVILEPEGGFKACPCKPDIFAATYEPCGPLVESSPASPGEPVAPASVGVGVGAMQPPVTISLLLNQLKRWESRLLEDCSTIASLHKEMARRIPLEIVKPVTDRMRAFRDTPRPDGDGPRDPAQDAERDILIAAVEAAERAGAADERKPVKTCKGCHVAIYFDDPSREYCLDCKPPEDDELDITPDDQATIRHVTNVVARHVTEDSSLPCDPDAAPPPPVGAPSREELAKKLRAVYWNTTGKDAWEKCGEQARSVWLRVADVALPQPHSQPPDNGGVPLPICMKVFRSYGAVVRGEGEPDAELFGEFTRELDETMKRRSPLLAELERRLEEALKHPPQPPVVGVPDREQMLKRFRREFLTIMPGVELTDKKRDFVDRMARRAVWALEKEGILPESGEQEMPPHIEWDVVYGVPVEVCEPIVAFGNHMHPTTLPDGTKRWMYCGDLSADSPSQVWIDFRLATEAARRGQQVNPLAKEVERLKGELAEIALAVECADGDLPTAVRETVGYFERQLEETRGQLADVTADRDRLKEECEARNDHGFAMSERDGARVQELEQQLSTAHAEIERLKKEATNLAGVVDHQGDQIAILGETERQELNETIGKLRQQLEAAHAARESAEAGAALARQALRTRVPYVWKNCECSNCDLIRKALADDSGTSLLAELTDLRANLEASERAVARRDQLAKELQDSREAESVEVVELRAKLAEAERERDRLDLSALGPVMDWLKNRRGDSSVGYGLISGPSETSIDAAIGAWDHCAAALKDGEPTSPSQPGHDPAEQDLIDSLVSASIAYVAPGTKEDPKLLNQIRRAAGRLRMYRERNAAPEGGLGEFQPIEVEAEKAC